MIQLNENLFIAKGAERECYIHPEDPTLLIKIQKDTDRNQNNLDIFYYTYLKTKSISYSNISKYHDKIETNKGSGIIFNSIKDYDGKFSKSFEDIVFQRILSSAKEKELLDELKIYLEINMIVFGDVVLSNILCQEYEKEIYKLIIVDGLGARRFGWKLWLHLHSKLFTKFRISKQWKKLISNYNEIKSKI